VPADAALELTVRPVGEAPAVRIHLRLRWSTSGDVAEADAVTLVPIRRYAGGGWPGWPAYAVALRLLASLDDLGSIRPV